MQRAHKKNKRNAHNIAHRSIVLKQLHPSDKIKRIVTEIHHADEKNTKLSRSLINK